MSFKYPRHELTTLLNLNENSSLVDEICNYLNRVTNSSKFTTEYTNDLKEITRKIFKDDFCICSWSSREWEPINKLYDRILKTIKIEELLFKLELL